MDKENDVQTLCYECDSPDAFPDGIYFSLELVYGLQPGYFWSLCLKGLDQGLLKGMGDSRIQTQDSHWVS